MCMCRVLPAMLPLGQTTLCDTSSKNTALCHYKSAHQWGDLGQGSHTWAVTLFESGGTTAPSTSPYAMSAKATSEQSAHLKQAFFVSMLQSAPEGNKQTRRVQMRVPCMQADCQQMRKSLNSIKLYHHVLSCAAAQDKMVTCCVAVC